MFSSIQCVPTPAAAARCRQIALSLIQNICSRWSLCVCLFSQEGQRKEASTRGFPCIRHLDNLQLEMCPGRWILHSWTQTSRRGQTDTQRLYLRRPAEVPRIGGQQRMRSTVLPWGPAYEPPMSENLHISMTTIFRGKTSTWLCLF